MEIKDPRFVTSVHHLRQLPDSPFPEIAFAGRSNVGKSSLINTILGRRKLVKISGRPGKTQGLNFFLVSERVHLVDLPGYGFAKVSKTMQEGWGELITGYLKGRAQLAGVVVIIDIRHQAKRLDTDLLSWLRQHRIPALAVYTKADKLSGNQAARQTRLLDAGHGLSAGQRLLFSARTGAGRVDLWDRLESLVREHQEGQHAQ